MSASPADIVQVMASGQGVAFSIEQLKAFVLWVEKVLKSQLVPGPEIVQEGGGLPPPGEKDYETAEMVVRPPPGGWITRREVQERMQAMTEAIALEKWVDGFVAAVQIIAMGGGAA